ncbi:MAG: hypothetical protein V3T22_04890 [Planctomycetota bacterium]
MALLFVASLSRRYRARGAAPHLAWWAAGVACYGLGTIFEAAVLLALSVVLSPVDLSALEFHRPIGDILLWNRVRYATPLTNLNVVFFLVGGCRSFRGSPRGSNGG